MHLSRKCGFPKIRGTILGVPIVRTLVFLGLYWGPPILGKYQITTQKIAWTAVLANEGATRLLADFKERGCLSPSTRRQVGTALANTFGLCQLQTGLNRACPETLPQQPVENKPIHPPKALNQ